MSEKRNWLISFFLVLAVIGSGVSGFYAGRSEAEARSREEREYEIRLNRSDLVLLDETEGPIYVTGHKSPDSDTVCCAIAYAELLKKLGYDARPGVLGEISRETEFILKTSGLEVPELLEDVSGFNLILVDHSDYDHSADGLKDANVLAVIDHHGAGSVTTGNQLIYDARPFGAASTIVWLRYRNYGIEPDPQVACALAGAILSDTSDFRSANTTFADREAVKALCEIGGIADAEMYYHMIYKYSISYEGMSDEQIFFNDFKKYEAGGTSFGIACVSSYDEETARDLAERMKKEFPSASAKTDCDLLYAQISIFHDDISITYLVPSDDAAEEVIQSIYGKQASFDGTSYVLNPGVSRRKDLVPAITEQLEAYPKE